MAAVHGKGTGVLFDEFDLSQYFSQASMVKATQVVDITTFSNNDKVFIAGQGSGSISLNGIWDGAVDAADEELDAAIGANAVITIGLGGVTTFGGPCIMLQALEAGYQIRSTVNDAVRITANAEANGGIRAAGVILHELSAETTTENGTSVDQTAQSAHGGVGHIHVTAFSGTSGVVKIQDSADNSNWADLITFSTVTGITAEHATVTGTDRKSVV